MDFSTDCYSALTSITAASTADRDCFCLTTFRRRRIYLYPLRPWIKTR